MPTPVSDTRSNAPDQIAHAARVIGRASQRSAVFEAICFGKKRNKTVEDLVERTKLPRKRVLEEARKLVNKHLIAQSRVNGQIVYEKDDFLAAHRREILSLAGDKKKLDSYPTKATPKATDSVKATIITMPAKVDAVPVTVDDMQSFSKVRKITGQVAGDAMSEAAFKSGLNAVIGETGEFKDWGGEQNDLFTTKVRIGRRRVPAAFAFKGPATKGKLKPRQMGKNADQIQRLFRTPAQAFFVQYDGQIDESVVEQMKNFAAAKSALEGIRIWYGVIDGDDTRRLVAAYPTHFGTA